MEPKRVGVRASGAGGSSFLSRITQDAGWNQGFPPPDSPGPEQLSTVDTATLLCHTWGPLQSSLQPPGTPPLGSKRLKPDEHRLRGLGASPRIFAVLCSRVWFGSGLPQLRFPWGPGQFLWSSPTCLFMNVHVRGCVGFQRWVGYGQLLLEAPRPVGTRSEHSREDVSDRGGTQRCQGQGGETALDAHRALRPAVSPLSVQ